MATSSNAGHRRQVLWRHPDPTSTHLERFRKFVNNRRGLSLIVRPSCPLWQRPNPSLLGRLLILYTDLP